MKRFINQSPNYSKKTRSKSKIKFVIIHYTGMQSEIESFKRLTKLESGVSCHYFINRKGVTTKIVEANRIAWHAGKSKWKNIKNLNENSIGIELVNRGHEYGYQNFTNQQIKSLIALCRNLKKKFKIKKENFLGHSDVAPLRKMDPGEKFPWKKLSKYSLGIWHSKIKKRSLDLPYNKKVSKIFFKNLHKIGYRYFNITKRRLSDKLVIRAFQQRYLPKRVSGKIDQKTYEICHFLAN